MYNVAFDPRSRKRHFEKTSRPFLDDAPKLHFSEVLPAETIMVWKRPARPEWMSKEIFETIPKTMELRVLKHSLVCNGFRCKSPEMAEREFWATLSGYNLVRKAMCEAASFVGQLPPFTTVFGARKIRPGGKGGFRFRRCSAERAARP